MSSEPKKINMVEKNTGLDSWPLIIILIVLFWPVGVYLLVRKLKVDRKASLSSGRKMIVWGWIIVGMGVISWSTLIEENWVSGTLGTLFFISAGLVLVYFGEKSSVNAVKYKKYINLVVNKKVQSIGTIASAIPVSHDIAIKDLQEMIDKGFFENAYLNYTSDKIVLAEVDTGDAGATDYQNYKAVMLVVTCNGCGANNKVEKKKVDNCQYCGSLISGA